jgi:putative transposase
MLFLILFFQSPKTFRNIGREVNYFLKNKSFKTDEKEVISDRFVELINFCLMPNHFHMTVKNVTDNGISTYLHRVQNAYAHYFNTRYEKSGHVFQGTYKAKRISSDEQLQHLSAYIHKNPKEINSVKNTEDYPWSSFFDYVQENRWGDIIVPDVILGGYSSKEKYKDFVKTNTAKDSDQF